jgi:hypothetical protein
LDHYEDTAGTVGVRTITASGAYSKLTDAIGGRGDLREAKVTFQLEAALLAVAHQEWALAAQALLAQVSDGRAWQETFMKGNPFEEVDRQRYGEVRVLSTEDIVLRDCE